MTDTRSARVRKLRAQLVDDAWAGIVLTHLPNLRYLTGFSGTAAIGFLTADRFVLITDFRYAEQAPLEVGEVAEVRIERRHVWDRLVALINASVDPADRIAVEADWMTLGDRSRLSAVEATITPATGIVELLRASKDIGEVEAIRAAATLAQEAFDALLPQIRPGVPERSLAGRLEAELRDRGSEWHPFPTIIASGPRSALPHAGTSERPVGNGEFLLIDFGAQVRGYCADLTRTVLIGGSATEKQRSVYDAVREAQHTAIAGIRAGMPGREADALARTVLETAGYGEAFGHALGHGLGLEVHEGPRLSPTSDDPLPEGAVVTIEPGVYLPGWGGVRLEEDIWLAPEGPIALSQGAADLIVLH